MIGGNKGVLRLAARYADEWNAPFVTADDFRAMSSRLDMLLQEQGRRPGGKRDRQRAHRDP